MRSRDRIGAVLNGEKPDRFPVDLWYTPEIASDLKRHFNVDNDLDLYRQMGLDKIVWVFPGYDFGDERSVDGTSNECECTEQTIWGVPVKTVKSGKAEYQEFCDAPLKSFSKPEEIENYPYWPNPEKFDYASAKEAAGKAKEDFFTLGPWISFFEVYCQMRGLEQSLMDLMTEPEFADALLDKIEDCQTKMLEKYLQTLGDDLDMVFISDDMGMQESLIVPPNIWDSFFKERMTRWCELIHSYDTKVFYHSDGAVEPLVAGLIETGIDILNPIQHVCQGMDMVELKKNYGQRLIFHGGVDNQSVLPFGSCEDVVSETRNCMETLGADGKGYIVCSCHNVQAGTPVENILAMIDTVKSYSN
jgi:uroporphyrinogen decarboxylase